MANSSMFSLPRLTAPAAASFSTTVASYGAWKPVRIFEAQLVSTPRVQNRSLWAIGAPSRAPFSPEARRASAARACSRACSSVTVMKLFSCGSSWRIRPSSSRLSSSAEHCLAARARAISARVSWCMGNPFLYLFDDFRHEVEAVFHGRGDGLIFIAMIFFSDHIGAQALGGFQRVGQRLDTVGVHGLHGVDQAKNVVEGLGGLRNLALAEPQAGQVGDLFHVGAFKRHRGVSGKRAKAEQRAILIRERPMSRASGPIRAWQSNTEPALPKIPTLC